MIDLLLLTLIPVNSFDQQKFEALLRNTPEAQVRTQEITNGERRFVEFPRNLNQGFQISCVADFLFGSAFPSRSNCALNIIKELSIKIDEHLIEIKDPQTVRAFYKAIPEGKSVKKFYSNELVYGLKLNSTYGNHFRYSLSCSELKCDLTFSTR